MHCHILPTSSSLHSRCQNTQGETGSQGRSCRVEAGSWLGACRWIMEGLLGDTMRLLSDLAGPWLLQRKGSLLLFSCSIVCDSL